MRCFLLVILLCSFFGCVTASVKTPDGMEVNYSSYGDRYIDGVIFKKTKSGFYFQMNQSQSVEQDLNVLDVGEIK